MKKIMSISLFFKRALATAYYAKSSKKLSSFKITCRKEEMVFYEYLCKQSFSQIVNKKIQNGLYKIELYPTKNIKLLKRWATGKILKTPISKKEIIRLQHKGYLGIIKSAVKLCSIAESYQNIETKKALEPQTYLLYLV